MKLSVTFYLCCTMDANPVYFTPLALNALLRLKNVLKVTHETGIRIGIKKESGCATPDFVIGFDEKKTGDMEYEAEGLKILMHKTDSMHLLGLTIDYSTDEQGFVFRQ